MKWEESENYKNLELQMYEENNSKFHMTMDPHPKKEKKKKKTLLKSKYTESLDHIPCG